jgi:hypothetical protein
VEFARGGITAIGMGAELELDGSQARISIGSGTTNSALDKLATNNGTLLLLGDQADGIGGVSVTTTTSFTNDGTLQIDSAEGDGGSSLTIGGTLINAGTTVIGNTLSTGTTKVTATNLINDGSLTLQGIPTGAAPTATLDITGAAPSTLTGSVRISGDAELEFASGGITAIAAGAELELDGFDAAISIGNSNNNSALNNLSSNDGTLLLASTIAGGASVTTTTSLANDGILLLDAAGGEGASNLTVGGALSNAGAITIGNNIDTTVGLTTLTAAALDNSGTLSLFGNFSGATNKLISNGSTSNTGSLSIGAATELDVTGGNAFQQNAGTTTVAGLLAAAEVDANGGLIDFRSAITGGDGTGPFFIGSYGTLEFDAAVDASHAVVFTSRAGRCR